MNGYGDQRTALGNQQSIPQQPVAGAPAPPGASSIETQLQQLQLWEEMRELGLLGQPAGQAALPNRSRRAGYYGRMPVDPSKGVEVCFDFCKGMCKRGPSCRYSHDLAVMVQQRMSSSQPQCRDFLNGRCSRGILCKYSHAPRAPAVGQAASASPPGPLVGGRLALPPQAVQGRPVLGNVPAQPAPHGVVNPLMEPSFAAGLNFLLQGNARVPASATSAGLDAELLAAQIGALGLGGHGREQRHAHAHHADPSRRVPASAAPWPSSLPSMPHGAVAPVPAGLPDIPDAPSPWASGVEGADQQRLLAEQISMLHAMYGGGSLPGDQWAAAAGAAVAGGPNAPTDSYSVSDRTGGNDTPSGGDGSQGTARSRGSAKGPGGASSGNNSGDSGQDTGSGDSSNNPSGNEYNGDKDDGAAMFHGQSSPLLRMIAAHMEATAGQGGTGAPATHGNGKPAVPHSQAGS
ncbi:unnamed protein product [Pedinophyceae sp. YPF-701]|nr:unnamed protein product [Pedinophyceae sp. YPF-701]